MNSHNESPVRSRRPRRVRRAALASIAAFALACQSVETYLPDLIAIGGTIAQVAAISYAGGQYSNQVNLLMQTLTPAGISIATAYAAKRRQQRELDRLLALEEEIEQEYATVDDVTLKPANASAPGDWGNAAEEQGGSWTNVADEPGTKPVSTGLGTGSPWDGINGGSYVLPKGVTPKGITGPLSVDVAILKRELANGKEIGVPLEDFAVLSGDANGGAGDQLRVFFSPAQDSYVYVIAVDSRARVQPLFPPALPPSGPLMKGAKIVLPAPDDWYGLDKYKGLQHVYVYVSSKRNEKLEALMYRFASQPPPASDADKVYTVSEPTVIEAEQVKARGLTNVRPQTMVKIPSSNGEASEFNATQITAGAAGEDLVLTRVFKHQ